MVTEATACLDVPVSLIKNLNEPTCEAIVRELSGPIKVAATIGACIVEWAKKDQGLGKGNKTVAAILPTKGKELIDNEHSNCHEEECTYLRDRMRGYQRAPDEGKGTNTEKAVKHDKAAVPTELWDDRVRYLLGLMHLKDRHLRAFALLRQAML